ncbi:alcohol dehydrogenase small subunit [Acetobacter tropicalis NRIC 0312]|uniref:Alcohol dehydrogenase n=1 Tax=Acetobacter tropicalis TaxID=104102 RepID=A0A0C9LKI3_9PROT|nr:DUF2501 domain-containing protein [Acetobacter tropicalis]KXV50196.1 alcohol dehydrogenase [Acetobacter tropicalis]KXV57700.1 alcohol dehydrogenase [Acetobacter tropicalis]OUI85757.1 alcohol dehydrogenase [Acetobacter tropicalis]GAL99099.1 alcohol dehydrogenase [Acetobacter tropicalis]GBR67706.1 alcohol dehydrogenase small subunit [Acetobacter tropicalis NRIC 0312]
MKLISVRALSALAVTTMLAGAPVFAHAADTPAPVSKGGEQAEAGGKGAIQTDADLSGYVGSINPVEVAGLLNYCTQGNYVDYDDGFKVLQSYNQKTNAVPDGQEGNMYYARGTAGQLQANGKTYSIATSSISVRQKTCAAVLSRAKAAL